MSLTLNKASEAKLKGVHPDLVKVIRRAAKDWRDQSFTFIVTCGVRTLAEQKVLVKKGASKTLRSRHIPAKNGFSHAADLAAVIDGKVRWDWGLYIRLANAMKAAAVAENVPIRWGGSWERLNTVKGPITAAILDKSFPDGPHYELPREVYNGSK